MKVAEYGAKLTEIELSIIISEEMSRLQRSQVNNNRDVDLESRRELNRDENQDREPDCDED